MCFYQQAYSTNSTVNFLSQCLTPQHRSLQGSIQRKFKKKFNHILCRTLSIVIILFAISVNENKVRCCCHILLNCKNHLIEIFKEKNVINIFQNQIPSNLILKHLFTREDMLPSNPSMFIDTNGRQKLINLTLIN